MKEPTKKKYIVEQYLEISSAYTEAMQIVHHDWISATAISAMQTAHEIWVSMNSVKDMMTDKEKNDAIKALAERAVGMSTLKKSKKKN